jgi:hypothetical protein
VSSLPDSLTSHIPRYELTHDPAQSVVDAACRNRSLHDSLDKRKGPFFEGSRILPFFPTGTTSAGASGADLHWNIQANLPWAKSYS